MDKMAFLRSLNNMDANIMELIMTMDKEILIDPLVWSFLSNLRNNLSSLLAKMEEQWERGPLV